MLHSPRWDVYDELDEGAKIMGGILQADYNTSVHDFRSIGLRDGEHVAEDGGDPRQEASVNTERHTVVGDEDNISVIEPEFVVLHWAITLRSGRGTGAHLYDAAMVNDTGWFRIVEYSPEVEEMYQDVTANCEREAGRLRWG